MVRSGINNGIVKFILPRKKRDLKRVTIKQKSVKLLNQFLVEHQFYIIYAFLLKKRCKYYKRTLYSRLTCYKLQLVDSVLYLVHSPTLQEITES